MIRDEILAQGVNREIRALILPAMEGVAPRRFYAFSETTNRLD
jgi:hypothetical protein